MSYSKNHLTQISNPLPSLLAPIFSVTSSVLVHLYPLHSFDRLGWRLAQNYPSDQSVCVPCSSERRAITSSPSTTSEYVNTLFKLSDETLSTSLNYASASLKSPIQTTSFSAVMWLSVLSMLPLLTKKKNGFRKSCTFSTHKPLPWHQGNLILVLRAGWDNSILWITLQIPIKLHLIQKKTPTLKVHDSRNHMDSRISIVFSISSGCAGGAMGSLDNITPCPLATKPG